MAVTAIVLVLELLARLQSVCGIGSWRMCHVGGYDLGHMWVSFPAMHAPYLSSLNQHIPEPETTTPTLAVSLARSRDDLAPSAKNWCWI